MIKFLFIIAFKNFRDEELLIPQKILNERGIKTTIASIQKGKAQGKLGTEVEVDLVLTEIKVDEFDGIVFVGGRGATVYFDNKDAWELARQFNRREKLVAAICIAPSILANAGILLGKKVTAFPTEEQNLKNKGAEYSGMAVEVDGNIITAQDPAAAEEFAQKIIEVLES